MDRKQWTVGALAFLLGLGVTGPGAASTFGRVGLGYLVGENDLVVAGEVVEAHSYWNEPGTLILTEVRIVVSDVLKGKLDESEIIVMLPGGTIGDRANVVLGGAELTPGNSYLLFLRLGNLPGARGVRIVGDHSQGVFELKSGRDGLRAVSQAVRHALVPDAAGNADPLGGRDGLSLDSLRQSVRELVARNGRQEVK